MTGKENTLGIPVHSLFHCGSKTNMPTSEPFKSFFCVRIKKACSDVRAAHVMEFPKSVFSACCLSPGYKGTHSDSTVPVLYSHTSKHCLNNPGKYTQKQAGLRQLSWLKNTWPFMTSQDIFLSCLEVKRKARQIKKNTNMNKTKEFNETRDNSKQKRRLT